VTGFTTGSPDFYESTEGKRLLKFFTRVEPMRLSVIKPFEQRFKSCRHAFANAKDSLMCCNIDGESLLWAARRLAARRESNRVLIVLTDGLPNARPEKRNGALQMHLYRTVRKIQRSGIKVICFGIMDESVARYYPDHVIFRSLDELPRGGFARIASILKKAHTIAK